MKNIFLCFVAFLPQFTYGQSGNCNPGNSSAWVVGENVKTSVQNQGNYFGDLQPPMGFQWPTTSSTPKHMIFSGGLWFGGIEQNTHGYAVSAQTFWNNGERTYWPGPTTNGSIPTNTRCSFWNRHFSMDKNTVLSFQEFIASATLPLDPAVIPPSIREWPGNGNPYLKASALAAGYGMDEDFDGPLAPFFDQNGDGKYDPALGDYPDLSGKLSMVWWVTNDMGNQKSFQNNTVPSINAGLEFHHAAYTYPASSHPFLANAVFLETTIHNKWDKGLDSCYIGFWVDYDLGNANDDYVQCDVMRNLGICYNSDNLDEGTYGFGANPPAMAFKAVEGPKALPGDGIDNNRNGQVDEPGEKTLFSSFKNLGAGPGPTVDMPNRAPEFYNLLKGKWKDNSSITYGGTGSAPESTSSPATAFQYPGASDPVGYGMGGTPQNPKTLPSWAETDGPNAAGDRRVLMCAGPFRLWPGSIERYTVVSLIASGGTNLQNLAQLTLVSDAMDQFLASSTSTRTNKGQNEPEVTVYPNPGSGTIWVECGSIIETIQILDSKGRLVLETKPEARVFSLDLATQPAGIYSIQVASGNGVGIKKLVKW